MASTAPKPGTPKRDTKEELVNATIKLASRGGMEAARPPPPFKTTFSAQNARTKAHSLTE